MRTQKGFGLALATISSWRHSTLSCFFSPTRQRNILLATESLVKNGISPVQWSIPEIDVKAMQYLTSNKNNLSENDKADNKFLFKNNICLNKLEKTIRGTR